MHDTPNSSTNSQESIDAVLQKRDSTHGGYRHNSAVMQAIETAVRSGRGYEVLTDAEKTAITYIAGKLSRIVSIQRDENTNLSGAIDSWLDIEGYAKLARSVISE